MTHPVTDTRHFEWSIDSDDRIVSVNDAWLAFAEENEPYFADPMVIVGRPLWEFVTDVQTRRIYTLLIERLRRTREPLTVPFRCDSPGCRRFMEVTLSPDGDGGVRFVSRMLHQEHRPEVEWMASSHLVTERLLTLCSWCKKIKLPGNEYVEVERAIERLDLFGELTLPQFTHGCCPQCLESMMAHIRKAQ